MKIEQGIPIPTRSGVRQGRPTKHPMRLLNEGESIHLRIEDGYSRNSVMCSVRYHNHRYSPMKWTYRQTEEGVRVWRTC